MTKFHSQRSHENRHPRIIDLTEFVYDLDMPREDWVPSPLELGSFEEIWTMLTVGAPPVQALFDRVGPGAEERVHDALAQLIVERFGSGPIRFTNAATIGYGVAG
jgi:hypothetical protein